MASKATARSFQFLTRRTRTNCQCLGTPSTRTTSIRQISATSSRPEPEYETEKAPRPRWSYTPEAMKAPYPVKLKDPAKAWEANSDPKLLDQFYIRFLGQGGDTVLTDEVKWLAITHKSFDQGRRGFNDRLAFLGMAMSMLVVIIADVLTRISTGRRIISLQATIALLHSPIATKTQTGPDPNDKRVPFKHPALDGLGNLIDTPVSSHLTKERLGLIATQAGMREVLRWKPKMVSSISPHLQGP